MLLFVGHSVIEFGVRHWHPSFMVSCSFTVQVLSQLDLLMNFDDDQRVYKNNGHLQPKDLDVKVENCTFQLSIRSSLDVLMNVQVGKSGIPWC